MGIQVVVAGIRGSVGAAYGWAPGRGQVNSSTSAVE
jgi:hypothetical protein